MAQWQNKFSTPSFDGDMNMTDARQNPQVRAMKIGAALLFAAAAFGFSPVVLAQAATAQTSSEQSAESFSTKIGFVNTQRILSDSAPARAAQKKIEDEFNKREEELQKQVADFRKRVQQFERDAPVLAESDRNRRQRELGNIDADLQRKQREIQEDFNRRRNEEFAEIIERANAAILEIADKENYDLILQDAVTVSERVDITDKVIKLLEK